MDVTKLKSGELLKKYVNNKSLYIIIIIGIVFMMLQGTSETHRDNKAQNHDAYSDEERLGDILSKIDGVGRVDVMITYYGTVQSDIAFESKQNASSGADSVTKSEESTVITSGSSPMVKGMLYPRAKGVIVIAEGAESVRIKKDITDAAVAVLDVPSYRVCVLAGKKR